MHWNVSLWRALEVPQGPFPLVLACYFWLLLKYAVDSSTWTPTGLLAVVPGLAASPQGAGLLTRCQSCSTLRGHSHALSESESRSWVFFSKAVPNPGCCAIVTYEKYILGHSDDQNLFVIYICSWSTHLAHSFPNPWDFLSKEGNGNVFCHYIWSFVSF